MNPKTCHEFFHVPYAEAARLDQAIAKNLTCLCMSARRQEELGYGK